MSFFDDFVSYLDVGDLTKEISVSIILNKGLVVVGNVKLVDFSNEEIVLKSKNEQISIKGLNLIIKQLSLGEIIILGKVTNVFTEKV